MEQSLNILAKDKSICHKIITGDFNIDLIKFEFHTSTGDFLEMLMQNGFLPTVLLPTKVTNHSCTLTDHMYYSTPRNRTQFKCGNLLTDMSDHFAIFFILYTSKNSKKKLENRPMVRLFSEQNKLKFQEILTSCGYVKLLDCVGIFKTAWTFLCGCFSVLQCRDLMVYVYCLFDLTDMVCHNAT